MKIAACCVISNPGCYGILSGYDFSYVTEVRSLGPNSFSSQGNTLKHLVLSKNQLSEVPTAAISHLKNLEHLNLNENQITILRDEAFLGLSKVCIKDHFLKSPFFKKLTLLTVI